MDYTLLKNIFVTKFVTFLSPLLLQGLKRLRLAHICSVRCKAKKITFFQQTPVTLAQNMCNGHPATTVEFSGNCKTLKCVIRKKLKSPQTMILAPYYLSTNIIESLSEWRNNLPNQILEPITVTLFSAFYLMFGH